MCVYMMLLVSICKICVCNMCMSYVYVVWACICLSPDFTQTVYNSYASAEVDEDS